MLKPLIDVLRPEVSGAGAFDYVAGIARYHRIQASPGFRDAARFCARQLESAGLQTEVLSYPARFGQTYWSESLFQEWSCETATLDLISPDGRTRRLCDFRANPQSVIQRSVSTPEGGLEGEAVVVDQADSPESYRDVDVSAKFVLFTGEAQRAYELAVVTYGAVGLVTDQMPEFPPVRRAFELPGATTYTSFWPQSPYPRPAVGFVLTPSEGAALRRLLRDTREAGRVRLLARVKGSLYDGEMENVAAVIPGTGAGQGADGPGTTGPEEVWLIAHLCHPKPSANDNASGSGTLLEVARALSSVVGSGRLPRPRRTIRFLLVPELTGTYAYLATNESAIPRAVGALNLDMVGENQALTGGPLQVEAPPLASDDYVSDLLGAILDAISGEGRNFGGTASYPLFMSTRSPFSGGSDHFILADPTVGVPCPMIIQFPDRFYHTSADTLDKVDPAMLGRVGLMSAAYVYFLASAGPREAAWLAGLMASGFEREASSLADEAVAHAAEGSPYPRFAARLGLRADRKRASLRALADRLGGPSAEGWLGVVERSISAAVERAQARVDWAADALDSSPPELPLAAASPAAASASPAKGSTTAAADAASALQAWTRLKDKVATRVYRGPVRTRSALRRLPPERRDHWLARMGCYPRGMTVNAQLLYWVDGRRTVEEIADLLELDTGFRDNAFVAEYLQALEEGGFVRFG